MTAQKQFCSEFDVLYLTGNNPCVGGVQCLISSATLFPRVIGKGACFRALEKTTWKRHASLGGQGSHKASRFYYLG